MKSEDWYFLLLRDCKTEERFIQYNYPKFSFPNLKKTYPDCLSHIYCKYTLFMAHYIRHIAKFLEHQNVNCMLEITMNFLSITSNVNLML